MKLYVANTTLQHHEFIFWKPENSQLQRMQIPLMNQRLIVDDQPEIVRAIIDQHVAYGLLEARAMLRTRRFTGLGYRLDKPVDIESLMLAKQQNDAVLMGQSKTQREFAAALGARHALELGQSGDTETPKSFSMSIEEQQVDKHDKAPKLKETVEVVLH
jgi:hypothetical protein